MNKSKLTSRTPVLALLISNCALAAALSVGVHAAEPKKPSLDITKLPASSKAAVDFARDIQPLLAKNCHSCHGPEKQKNGLRLDRKTDALAGGDSGKAILPGKSAESMLIHYVAGLDPDTMMPPKGDRLTIQEIGKLRAWIDAGAPWPEQLSTLNTNISQPSGAHWAFKAPQRVEPPKIKDRKRVRNPIDAFILARLEKEKIKPSPEADRVTLIRRLNLDLLGLLPTPEEVAAFVSDKRPDAYERLVDRLLASPHFGERWGRHWLDLARYADSDGYEKDSPRPYAYLFRDWVIDAINRDMPFDQFTIEQLAGDLLPNATEKQKQATAFHRQTLTNREGGVDKEEFRCKATVDRVSTTATVWLGLTVGCAECHTHKYDPITQREFYQLYAFFNNASEKDVPAPQPAELAEYNQQLKTWETKLHELKKPLQEYLTNVVETKLARWESSLELPSARWTVFKPSRIAVAAEGDETLLTAEKDNSISPRARDGVRSRFTVEAETQVKGITGFRIEALADPGKPVGRGAKGDFALSEFVVLVQPRDGEPRRIDLMSAKADAAATNGAAAQAIDGDRNSGWSIGAPTDRTHVIVFETREPIELAEGSKLIFKVEQFTVGVMNRFRIAATTSPQPIEPSTVPDSVVTILDAPREKRSAKQNTVLARYFAEQVDDEGIKLNKAVATHSAKKPKFPETTAAILVADERKANVHIRGDFLRKGDEVQPATLAVLHPLKPRGEKSDRLDLAHWLVDPANPLTARVTVNHVWKNLFGRALVTSVNDFGTRGETPSHPELLDWLAIAFRSPANASENAGRALLSSTRRVPRSEMEPPVGIEPRRAEDSAALPPVALGWSRKALIRLIVTSSTYRQSSSTRSELMQRDPSNILLARQNRFRLEAENVRDIYLAASGLLNPAIGGPSIRPQLPADIAALGYANSVKWTESKGAEKYRRGLYIFFQRTVPYPMLMTFDAPDSNASCTRRERSNTPLQALTLLNDPVFFECAQALAKRVAKESGAAEEKIRKTFQRCLSRGPTKAEMRRLSQLYSEQLKLLEPQAENVAKLADEKDANATDTQATASLVALCRVIMNLDEFVTRE